MKLFRKRSDEPKQKARSSSSRSSTNAASSNTKPGAASIDSNTSLFRVMIPENIEPGQEFQVYAGNRVVRVRCPEGSSPGQSLQITVPTNNTRSLSTTSNGTANGSSPMPPDSPNVSRLEDDADNPGGPTAYNVTIPTGIRGGQQFPVTIQGQQLMVTCPVHARPGMKVKIVPPPPPRDVTQAPESHPNDSNTNNPASSFRPPSRTNSANSRTGGRGSEEETQLFEVLVPEGVQPGSPFALLAGGVRVLVQCPHNASPGQRIRFKLPLALTQAKSDDENSKQSDLAAIKLSYDKDGWTRTIRVSDMKFQWVRMDDTGGIDTNVRFHADKSAYVRKLEFIPGQDARICDGIISLVPANQAFVDSRIPDPMGGPDIVMYSDIANAQGKGFEDKSNWFVEKCKLLRVEWDEGHMRINIRRQFLLEDSVDAIMSLSPRDLRKVWRFEFIGEMGIDAGGLAREWFEMVTREIFDPDTGLWQCSEANQMCMQINPASKYICDDYLIYYRFLGRVMGKALFDRQLVIGHMVQYIYKHMLGWPITFKDIERVDDEYYNNLLQMQQLVDAGEDLSMLCLEFAVTEEVMGMKEEVELIPGGLGMEVSNDNFPEYLEACLKHRMLDRVKSQLNELLLGFFDVIAHARDEMELTAEQTGRRA